MKPSTQEACNNLIINMPEELLTDDWEALQRIVPADLFLQGVFDWLFANQQEPLNDLLETALDDAVKKNDGNRLSQEAEHLIHKVAALFYDEFADFLKDLVPEDFRHPKYVKTVIYDHVGPHIYLAFEIEDMDDAPITMSASELIDQENEEDEDDDSDEESDDETDEVEPVDED